MKRFATWAFGLFAAALLLSAAPASAAPINVGVLALNDPHAFILNANGPSYSQDYNFHLNDNGVTILATAFGQSSSSFGIDSVHIDLYSAPATFLGGVSSATSVSLDSFADLNVALAAGDYILRIFGDVTPGKKASLLVAFSANAVNAVPVPAAGLLLLTGLGALGGFAARRKQRTQAAA